MARRPTLTLDDVKASKPGAAAAELKVDPVSAKNARSSARAGVSADEATPGERRRGQTLRLNTDAWRQLKILAVDEEKPAHDLLIEALNLLFASRGKPPLA